MAVSGVVGKVFDILSGRIRQGYVAVESIVSPATIYARAGVVAARSGTYQLLVSYCSSQEFVMVDSSCKELALDFVQLSEDVRCSTAVLRALDMLREVPYSALFRVVYV